MPEKRTLPRVLFLSYSLSVARDILILRFVIHHQAKRTFMNQKTYIVLTGLIFSVVMLMHAARMAFNWEVSIGGWAVPMWISWAGLCVSGLLAYTSVTLKKNA